MRAPMDSTSPFVGLEPKSPAPEPAKEPLHS
jgi:hypothetical protein